jgi:hypothetical protein
VERIIYAYDGLFQWWSYLNGHSQLLLRSAKSVERPIQIDILFKDVKDVSLPTVMDGFKLLEASDGASKSMRHFVVQSRDHKGYVIAGSVFCDEGNHECHEQSPLLEALPQK